jgi:uncharacterized RDD family membrane protein YckC
MLSGIHDTICPDERRGSRLLAAVRRSLHRRARRRHRRVRLRLVLRGAGIAISFVFSAGYFVYFHGRTGQTPGDAALGIRVVDIDNGEVIGYGRAFGRWLVSIVSGLVIVLGYLWMLWDGRKQTWHDKAVGSIPVRV